MSSAARPSRSARVAAGAWFGLALALARCGLVYAMDRFGRGLDEGMTLWRTAERVPWVLTWALATGIACAWLASTGASSRAARGIRVAVVAAAFLAVLAGWPFDDAYHVPGPGSARGIATLAALGAVALAGAGALAVLLRSGSAPGRALGRPASLAAASVLAVALIAAARFVAGDPGASMTVREVARSIALEPNAWRVESARASAPPHGGALTPSLRGRIDGGELPALVMPPPCRVSFAIGPEERGLRLHAAAGCDLTVARAFADASAAPRIVFRILIDGRTVLEHERRPNAAEDEDARVWSRLGGGAGIEVAPGARVTLETAFADERTAADVEARATLVGFGGLELERRSERPRTRASADRPNVVLVVMDTLRADRTSAYGYARPTTPALEALARRGTLYEQAFATSSWTWPSTASILTGLEPGAHGVISDAECYLADEIDTLPEVLQREGYTTAAFACNPLVAPTRNFDAGFETFEYSPDAFLSSEQVLPSVLGWLDAHASVRFFLYLHLIDPHELHRSRAEDRARFAGPKPADMDEHALHDYAERLLANEARTADGAWDPARVVPEAHRRWLSDAYDAAVATGDRALSQVIARLDVLSLSENTLVVFTSDHGEELLEHGHLQHGQSVHTELVHVPLVIAGPGVPAGARVATPVSNRHLAPTLARIGGARLALPGAVDLLDRARNPESEPIFLATECGWWSGARDVAVRAVRADGWSLHCRLGVDEGARLYDLRADPGELVDLAAAQPGLGLELRRRIEEHERAQIQLRPRTFRAGAGTRELLRATGYAGEER